MDSETPIDRRHHITHGHLFGPDMICDCGKHWGDQVGTYGASLQSEHATYSICVNKHKRIAEQRRLAKSFKGEI